MLRLTSELNISANATRAALCRLVKQGWLQRNKIEGRAVYLLTPLGRERLEEVRPRIFSSRHSDWDGQWTILTYSVPERLGHHRDRLRRELEFLGFGSMTPSTWISPNALVDITLRHLSLGTSMVTSTCSALDKQAHSPTTCLSRDVTTWKASSDIMCGSSKTGAGSVRGSLPPIVPPRTRVLLQRCNWCMTLPTLSI